MYVEGTYWERGCPKLVVIQAPFEPKNHWNAWIFSSLAIGSAAKINEHELVRLNIACFILISVCYVGAYIHQPIPHADTITSIWYSAKSLC